MCSASSAEPMRRHDEAGRAIDELTPLTRITSWPGAPGSIACEHPPKAGDNRRPDPKRRGGSRARELEVLRLISTGLSNHAIAERLFISEHTVHRHVANTLAKLNVPVTFGAVAHAARLGLL